MSLALALEALKRAWSFALAYWRELLIAALAVAVIVQQARVMGRDGTIAKRDAAIQSIKDQQTVAAAKSEAHGATTGQEAVETYVERNEADAPVVERVVDRVRNVCLHDRAPARDLPVPEGAGLADGAAARARDAEARAAEDRAYAIAIGDDLETCAKQLNKLRGLQGWIRANGG